MLDPECYFTDDLNFIKTRYIDVITQLASLYREHRDTVVAERKARQHAYGTWHPKLGERDSHAARERFADAESLTEWLTVKDTEFEIQDLLEEKALLLNLVEWHGIREN